MFWDSSALVPWLLPEADSERLTSLLVSDQPTIWWGSPVECFSAIHRRHRQAPLPAGVLQEALARVRKLTQTAKVVAAAEQVRALACHLVAVHPLRAADSLQLAAALLWCDHQPAGQIFVCTDQRLRLAASLQGFRVVPD